MDSGYVVFLMLAGSVFLVGCSFLKLINWLRRRYSRNMLRGNLREDYLKNYPDLSRDGNIVCVCGCKKIVLRNIPPTQGTDILREHVCQGCGKRLFFSASGDFLEGVIRELKEEAGYEV